MLNACTLPHELNDTIIVLIQKIDSLDKVTDMRPISLCNMLYKIVSKVLANRLKRVVGDVVGDSKSAFIRGEINY